ncbi:hypothetical protein Tco_0683413 [Tanacetum coccineum]|uniref:Uncharacterized protein n=1 Tax=Tanacetum coccineum TaxID=301880 RepID=A0ABQ4XTX2_9ASTR
MFDDDYSVDDESDDDGNACVEIKLITPIHSVATIPVGGNQSGGYVPSAAKGLSTRDLTGDAIDKDFFPFDLGPYYATCLKDGVVAGSYEFLTPGDMVRIEALTDDRLAGKINVLHCLMMLKSFQQRLTSFQGLESQVSGLKKQVTDLNDKVIASDTAFVKDKAKGKEQKKKIKSFSKSLDQFTAEAARLASDLNQARSLFRKFLASDEFSRVQHELLSLTASADFERGRLLKATSLVATIIYPFLNKFEDHSAHPLSFIVEVEPDRLARLAVVPTPRVVSVSPPLLKELNITPAPSSVELFTKDAPPSSTAASEQMEESLSVMGVAHRVCEDVNRVESSSIQESWFASSSSTDVVIALCVRKKERGSPWDSCIAVQAFVGLSGLSLLLSRIYVVMLWLQNLQELWLQTFLALLQHVLV